MAKELPSKGKGAMPDTTTIVMISGSAEPAAKSEGSTDSASAYDGWIFKPVDVKELKARLLVFIKRRRAGQTKSERKR